MISTWAKRRVRILQLLRNDLGFSLSTLWRIVIAWRCKFIFGSFWCLNLSEATFSTLCNSFSKLAKAAFGIGKLVPYKVTHSTLGLPNLATYYEYWFSIKRFEGGESGLFQNLERDLARLAAPTHGRPLRASTLAASARCREAKISYPDRAISTFHATTAHVQQLQMLKKGSNHKLFLKRKLFRGTPIIKLFDETQIKKTVQQLNEHYFRIYAS